MKIKYLVIILITALALSACHSEFTEGAFFSKQKLNDCEVKNLASPSGDMVRYLDSTVYVNDDRLGFQNYAASVYAFIQSLNFKHLYALEREAHMFFTYHYYVKEANELKDFLINDYENNPKYYFIYSNEDIKKNTDDKDILDAHSMVIDWFSNVLEYENKSFDFNYTIILRKTNTCFFS